VNLLVGTTVETLLRVNPGAPKYEAGVPPIDHNVCFAICGIFNTKLYSQYIFSLLIFVVKNRDLFRLNSDIHNIGTRHNNDFHLPSAQSKLFQKGVFYSGIKTYNHLPLTIKELSYDVKRFRWVLKRFIQSNSFYSLEEYFDFNW
jgi:hypothetical protein